MNYIPKLHSGYIQNNMTALGEVARDLLLCSNKDNCFDAVIIKS
jgi:hypothetical protein